MTFPAVTFVVLFIVFLISSTELEHFGNMPASFITLLFIGLISIAVHVMLNLVPDILCVKETDSEMYEEEGIE